MFSFLHQVKPFLDKENCKDLYLEEGIFNYSECSNSIFGISMKVPQVQVSTSSKPKKIQIKRIVNKDRQTAVTCSCSTRLPAFQHLKKTWRRSKMTHFCLNDCFKCTLVTHLPPTDHPHVQSFKCIHESARFSTPPSFLLSRSLLSP